MKYFHLIPTLLIACSCHLKSSTHEKDEKYAPQRALDSSMLNSTCSTNDSAFYTRIIKLSKKNQWQKEPISQIIVNVATQFINVPYVSSTLETNPEEKLVVNLSEVDCTTFVEYVSAISLCIKQDRFSLNDFQNQLIALRYRNSRIEGYSSRLHYFTDWLLENKKKGLIDIVSNQLGTIEYEKKINFMSAHPQFYKPLVDTTVLNKIKTSEINLSNQKLKLISKSDINAIESQIQDGDIIAFATSIEGLDVTHIAFAVRENGLLCILHASLNAKKVVFSSISLTEYLSHQPKTIGIFVGRIKTTATQ